MISSKDAPNGDGVIKSPTKHDLEAAKEKPKALPVYPAGIPDELKLLDRWVCWDYWFDGKRAKWTKVPKNPRSQQKAKSNDASTWGTFDSALFSCKKEKHDGIGFVFIKEDDICGIDLDDCRDLITGDISDQASAIISDFATHAEISPSGTGVKLYCHAKKSDGKNKPGSLEVYEWGRYFAVTGQLLPGTPLIVANCQQQLDDLQRRMSDKKEKSSAPSTNYTIGLDDQEVIDRAGAAKNGDDFRRLWSGDISKYGKDQSRADMALVGYLAFWTGPDHGRIERLFRMSGLMREKWERADYRQRTIDAALEGRAEFFEWGRAKGPHNGDGTAPKHKPPPPKLPRTDVVTSLELMLMTLPEPKFVVDGILAEGLSLLVSKPKLGKSWMALMIAVAVACGGVALGSIDCSPGSVLYLALEDNRRRLRKRLAKILTGSAAPEKLHLATQWPRLNEGATDELEKWIATNPDARLIIIDTFAKIRPRRTGNSNNYADDYQDIAQIKAIADHHGIAILLIHHDRKMKGDDPLEEVSGTMGITGAADSIMMLRRVRNQNDATLIVTGRDIEEREIALKWDPVFCLWTILGEAQEVHTTQQRREILDALAASGVPMSPKEVAEAIEKPHNSVKQLMFKLKNAGDIRNEGIGKYVTITGNRDNPVTDF